MTMLLGINYGKFAYLSADTRVKKDNKSSKDNIQKIVILPNKKIIAAAAGSLRTAKGIIDQINENSYFRPLNTKDVSILAKKFLAFERNKKFASKKPLNDAVLLFHFFDEFRIVIKAFSISFIINVEGLCEPRIKEYKVKHGEYIVIVRDVKDGIKIDKVPAHIDKYLNESNYMKITYYDYAIATDEIFKTSLQGKDYIGGKTTTIKTYIDSNHQCKYMGISGLKSLIHKKEEYQNVSTASIFDLRRNCFYLRDLRNDGRIITHIEYKGLGTAPVLRYDSCPKDEGNPDMYYIPFTQYSLKKLADLEM